MIDKLNSLGRRGRPFLFIIDFSGKNCHLFPLSRLDPGEILYSFPGVSNAPAGEAAPGKIIFKKYPPSYTEYKKRFDRVREHFLAGDTYLLNLTLPSRVESNLSLRQIFLLSRARYKLWFRGRFVVFSPECFVKITGGVISSHPMKGTSRLLRGAAERPRWDEKKELAEHVTIVDLIRNDLSLVAKGVRVKRFRYLETLKTGGVDLLQSSSRICGRLPDNYPHRIGEIIYKMLPAGSVTGAPKKKTVEIIKKVEGYARGYYTGVFGYFDGKNLDSAVMIRFIEKKGKQLFFKSGGGLTVYSRPEKEYRELVDKIYVPLV